MKPAVRSRSCREPHSFCSISAPSGQILHRWVEKVGQSWRMCCGVWIPVLHGLHLCEKFWDCTCGSGVCSGRSSIERELFAGVSLVSGLGRSHSQHQALFSTGGRSGCVWWFWLHCSRLSGWTVPFGCLLLRGHLLSGFLELHSEKAPTARRPSFPLNLIASEELLWFLKGVKETGTVPSWFPLILWSPSWSWLNNVKKWKYQSPIHSFLQTLELPLTMLLAGNA